MARSMIAGLVFGLLALSCVCALPGEYTIYADKLYTPSNNTDAYIRGYAIVKDVEMEDGTNTTILRNVGIEMSPEFIDEMLVSPDVNLIEIPGLNFTVMEGGPFMVPMPAQDINPYKFVMVGVQQTGHPPVGVYDIPHIDAHFMHITLDEYLSVWGNPANQGPCGAASPEVFYDAMKPIPAQCFPGRTHSQLGEFVYGHGSHLYPVMYAPEFNPPQHFNQTLIYGAFNGSIIFQEPMVSIDFLRGPVKNLAQWFTDFPPMYWPTQRVYPRKHGYYYIRSTGAVRLELKEFTAGRVGCEYNERFGWANWWPESTPVPGPADICTYPKPSM